MSEELKPCACGKIPEDIGVMESGTSKWAWAYGDCCGEWNVEFRTNYHEVGSEECKKLAVEGWNDASREAVVEDYEKESQVQLWLDYCELKDALHTIGYTPYNAKTMKRIARAALGEEI